MVDPSLLVNLGLDRKSTRLNSSHLVISYAVFCLKKKKLNAFGDLPIRLLSDDYFANAPRFHSYDEFEEMELHSTIRIDKQVFFFFLRTGGPPISTLFPHATLFQ